MIRKSYRITSMRYRIHCRTIILCICICIIFILYLLSNSNNSIVTDNVNKTTSKFQCDISLNSYKICLKYSNDITHNKEISNGIETYLMLKKENETLVNQSTYWNEDDRYKPFTKLISTSIDSSCQIIYCGANEFGTDGLHLIRQNKNCQVWFFEPIPIFYDKLIHSKEILEILKTGKHHLFNIGLSNKTQIIPITLNDIKESQALSLVNILNKHEKIDKVLKYEIILRDIYEILFEFNFLLKTETIINGELNLLHMNCEGCEYDVIERLYETNLIKYIRIIQFASHRLNSLRQIINHKYCCLQQSLTNTHKLIFSIPWAWERWIRYDLI
ncbi:unnamed protein product [Adineta steineri]|uniref:Methyltransferase FkbM domain-containing protein n=1 Tax=Adineta steineri TaxID=433720 RepID=A0A815DEW4_9BILA|nr:unnamed protein product [Adineta steineri]CAF1299963.1 unnamed protein product [Adineta steineri]